MLILVKIPTCSEHDCTFVNPAEPGGKHNYTLVYREEAKRYYDEKVARAAHRKLSTYLNLEYIPVAR